jgi:hypothetical protein
MVSQHLDFPVFDCDNHMYETTDALVRYLPEEAKGVIDYVEVGAYQNQGPWPGQRVHPEPHLLGRGRSGGGGGVLQERQLGGQVLPGDRREADRLRPCVPRARGAPGPHGRAWRETWIGSWALFESSHRRG